MKVGPVLEAYRIGVKEHGEAFMRARFEVSAVRLLKNNFRLGLFENPYLIPEQSETLVGNPTFMKEGYEAQLKSIVLLKNKNNVLPIQKLATVYIPKRFTPAGKDWFGRPLPETHSYPVNLGVVENYFNVTEDPEAADFGLVFIESPKTGTGYSHADVKAGGNGYLPISLQYGPYHAEHARDKSLAGDPRESDVLNRSYKGKGRSHEHSRPLCHSRNKEIVKK